MKYQGFIPPRGEMTAAAAKKIAEAFKKGQRRKTGMEMVF